MIFKCQCAFCGKFFYAKSNCKKYCSKKCRAEAKLTNVDKNSQLCCFCKFAIGGCSWSDNFVPVIGWDAIPTIIKDNQVGDISSFRIKNCPQFIYG